MSTNEFSKRKGGRFFPALCGILGTLILLAVIAVSAPLTVPRLLGYEMYQVVSGSMEPELPVGSVVYVKTVRPEEIREGDVIAFHKDDDDVVTHRVVANYGFDGKFTTKGDANEVQDFDPVPYSALIGRVEHHVPVIGAFMGLLAGTVGKVYLLCMAACGVMFNILASRLRLRRQERALIEESDLLRELSLEDLERALQKETNQQTKGESGAAPKKRHVLRTVLMVLALGIFLASGAGVLFIRQQYRVGEKLYSDAASRFTAVSDPIVIELPEAGEAEPKISRLPEAAPIQVDFDALQEINPDIVAWIYCPDTVINYPVLHGESNDDYLHHSYDKSYNVAGSIFVEESNERGLSDCNYILYGHHMGDKSMFATLDRWQEQGYFDEHPYMWLLTPEQDYKIFLYSAYTISAWDQVYTVYHTRVPEFESWLKKSGTDSAVEADVELDPDAKYVMLSTCAYIFEDARSVLHGQLQPISTAGGIPIPGTESGDA